MIVQVITNAINSTSSNTDEATVQYTVLSYRAIKFWAALITMVGVGMAAWLLLAYTDGNADINRLQLDAIRTAGTIVVGTGGATALLLAARRQRSTEIALKQKDRDQSDVGRAQALQERTALASETDAAARRVTDLYAKAVEQLGSEKAPVRLGGLYALERLAQDHVDQRQTIVNVLCAYLRMPYTLPGDPPADEAGETLITAHRERAQEREVRLTAQRILMNHLRREASCEQQLDSIFWADIDIDLTGAHLIDFDLANCSVRTARFSSAKFTGPASFLLTRFTDMAFFNLATFDDRVEFRASVFASHSLFNSANFKGSADFGLISFAEDAVFHLANFTRQVPPEVASFMSSSNRVTRGRA